MTTRHTYHGTYNGNSTAASIAAAKYTYKASLDQKHQTLTVADPGDTKNKIVMHTTGLVVHHGEIVSGTVNDYTITLNGKLAVSITGLTIDATGITSAMLSGSFGLYAYITDNIHGTYVGTGDKYDNIFDVGDGGKATINAGGGHDMIYISHAKNAVIDGGSGTDGLDFTNLTGSVLAAHGVAKVDLEKGTGTNPYGGTLTVKNVEDVINMFNGSSDLRGDKHANYLRGGASADTLMGRGGDDIISVRQNYLADPRATVADGGAGKDTLQADLTEAPGAPTSGTGETLKFFNVLNIDDPDKNTGTFHGGVYRNFETFQVYGDLTREVFQFTGSSADETVLSATADDTLNGRAGDDILDGSIGADKLIGGKGADHFQYQSLLDSTVAAAGRDTITDFSHAQHDRIDLSPMFPRLNFSSAYDFIGSKKFDGHSSEVRFEHHGSSTLVLIDDNGDKTADLEIVLNGHLNLVKGDFML